MTRNTPIQEAIALAAALRDWRLALDSRQAFTADDEHPLSYTSAAWRHAWTLYDTLGADVICGMLSLYSDAAVERALVLSGCRVSL